MSAAPAAPVMGLLLSGGRSTRMRRDKAALELGFPQVSWNFC